MSSVQVVVKYGGPALADHKMDVELVAPAMLALSELVKCANKAANGDRASVKVLVNADVNEHCFTFGIDIVQTLFEQAKDLLADDDVSTAIRIAEIVGVTGAGLFGLLKFLKGRPPDSTSLVLKEGRNVVQINVGGDVHYTHQETFKLYRDRDALHAAKTVTKPVAEEGYESLEFKSDQGIGRINHAEAKVIQETPVPDVDIDTIIPPSKIRAWVKIRKAVYDGKGKWNVQYERSRDVSMDDQEWLEKFQRNEVTVPPGSLLDVSMSVSEIEIDNRGRRVREPDHTITKVHDVNKPKEDAGLFDGQENDKPQKGDQTEES